jgi:glycosyltransferase involved in cell wall biosynthesis
MPESCKPWQLLTASVKIRRSLWFSEAKAGDVSRISDTTYRMGVPPTNIDAIPHLSTCAPHSICLRTLQIGMWWQTERCGGLDRVYANLVAGLPEAGIQVSGLVEGPEEVEALTNGRVHGFAPKEVGMAARLSSIRRTTAEYLRAFDPHVVGVHFALYAAVAGRPLRQCPMVVHFHGPWFSEAAQEGAGRLVVTTKRLVEQHVYRRADRVIVLSNAFGRLISQEFGVAEDRVRLVPGHVDIPRFAVVQTAAQARQILGWPLDRRILISVRRLTNRMGLDRLVAAMKRVASAEPDVLLCIAGTGARAEALRRQVQETGLDKHVRFLGFLPEVYLPLAFRAADINVVPTAAYEGFGLVAAEALAAGTPSMVTPVGGLPEVVGPLSTNLVFRSPTANDIADGLIGALRGAVLLPDATTCRAYAAANFASHIAVQRTAAVYRGLVEGTDG